MQMDLGNKIESRGYISSSQELDFGEPLNLTVESLVFPTMRVDHQPYY